MPKALLIDLVEDDWVAIALLTWLIATSSVGGLLFPLMVPVGILYFLEHKGMRRTK